MLLLKKQGSNLRYRNHQEKREGLRREGDLFQIVEAVMDPQDQDHHIERKRIEGGLQERRDPEHQEGEVEDLEEKEGEDQEVAIEEGGEIHHIQELQVQIAIDQSDVGLETIIIREEHNDHILVKLRHIISHFIY